MILLLEFVRRRMGYRLPRPTTWLIHGLNYVVHCQVTTELVPGINVHLDLRDDFQRSLFWLGLTFEHPAPAILQAWCADQATTFFDIGANVGFYAYYILAACPGVTVYSFEPNPALYAQHIMTKTRNQLARFFPFNLGLSDTTDSLTLHMIAGDSGASTFGPHPSSMSQANAMKSQVTSFDEWVQKMNLSIPPTPTWVAKIDVEGYEVKVLQGMKEALQARAFKGVCIEVNQFTLKFCDETSQTLYTLMETLGYQAYDERGQRTGPQRDEFRNVFFRPM